MLYIVPVGGRQCYHKRTGTRRSLFDHDDCQVGNIFEIFLCKLKLSFESSTSSWAWKALQFSTSGMRQYESANFLCFFSFPSSCRFVCSTFFHSTERLIFS